MITYATLVMLDVSAERIMPAVLSWLSTIGGATVTAQTLAQGGSHLSLAKATVDYILHDERETHLASFQIHHHRQNNAHRRTEIGIQGGNAQTMLTVLVREEGQEDNHSQASPTPGLIPLIVRNWPHDATTPHGDNQMLTAHQNALDRFISLIHDPARKHPILLVSPARDGNYLIDAETLANRAVGLAHVVTVLDPLVTQNLDGLLDADSNAHSGAVRIIGVPGQSERNWLWTPAQIAQMKPDEQLDRILRQTVDSHLKPLVMAHHVTASYVLDAQRRHIAARFSQAISTPEAMDRPDLVQYVDLLEKEIERSAERRAQDLSQIAELKAQLDKHREEALILHGEISQLRHAIANVGSNQTGQSDFQNAMRSLITGQPSLHESLTVIAQVYPERIVVLPSAWRSAADSNKFRYLDKAFELLWRLTTTYWECMSEGGGDTEARHLFGNAYAANESEHVINNEKGRRNRTFEWQDEAIPFWRHLKIGFRDSSTECLRVHFHWDAASRRVIVGHVGAHLPY